MGWTSYYVGSKSLKDCMADEMAKFPKYNHKIKKSVQKGNNFYYLMESPKGEDWVLLMKGSKSKGEFYYKDIQCNPYESGVPSSILKAFKPSNDDDKAWVEKQLKALAEKKATAKTFKIGDIVKCRAKYDIEWGNGVKVAENTDFYIRVQKKPYTSKNIKNYILLRETKNLNGEPCLRETNCRLMNKSFDNLASRELVTDLKTDGYLSIL